MRVSNTAWVRARAEGYFREIERLLLDLTFVRSRVRERMKSLQAEYRKEFPFLRLSLRAITRGKGGEPTALYWGHFYGPPSAASRARAGGKKLPRWWRYCTGGLSAKAIFYGGAKEHKERIRDYDRRAQILNAPYHALTRILQSIRMTLIKRKKRRDWESGDLEIQAPLVSAELPREYRRAMEGAWLFVCRMTAVEAEFIAIRDRYRERPAYRDFRLVYRRDSCHRYGALLWLHQGLPLPADDKGSRNLTVRRLWAYRIPYWAHQPLIQHEKARRLMVRLHDRYIAVMWRMKRRTGNTLAGVDESLARQRPGEARVS